MKKVLLLLILFSSMIFMNSCGIKDGDSTLARTNMLTLFNYVENDNVEQIYNLFSPIIKEKVIDLDAQINDMCDFVQGEYKSITNLGLGTSISYDYGKETRTFEMFYIIETTTNTYFYSILWKIVDDYEADNIGIWSIYLEEKIDDNLPSSHKGWNDGINIIY